MLEFCKTIVDATHEFACAFKVNHAFFAAYGLEDDLADLIEYVHIKTGLPVILDAKRADIGATSHYYAEEVFTRYESDAVTVNPYLGWDGLSPFLEHQDKGIFVLCRTSNEGSSWLQNQPEENPIYLQVAQRVNGLRNGNVGLVVGATYIDELREIRCRAPDAPLLIPGVGTQGGTARAVVEAARSTSGNQFTINVSRGIIHKDQSSSYLDVVERSAREYSESMSISE